MKIFPVSNIYRYNKLIANTGDGKLKLNDSENIKITMAANFWVNLSLM
jgi:hypothetical protein